MSLKFHANHAVFDDQADAVKIPAVDGNKLVVCAVAHGAIRKVLWAGDGPATCLVDAYRRFRHAFHLVAASKYRLKLLEPNGDVLVAPDDIPDLTPPWDYVVPQKPN